MPELLGPTGQPMSLHKKSPPPKLGTSYGRWSGPEHGFPSHPASSPLFNFNLDQLMLSDYRVMRDHPQVNASLCLLQFMVHQVEWHIDCTDKAQKEFYEMAMKSIWTRLIRALGQAFWAGFSPSAIEYDYDENERKIVITKIKDLYPEDCEVKWKEVPGARGEGQPQSIPPKFKIFDGIKQWGVPDIPALNSLWYPFGMENGNFFGHKILRSAYMPWFYSMLMHMFASRYYERFGEPTPIGRAPMDAEVEMTDGTTVSGRVAMETIMAQMRNRASVYLPSDRDMHTKEFEYQLEYLESEMRGIDFERFMGRLDEEISLAIFTPVLLFKNGDTGSNNLGVQHTQTFLWMLNSIIGDMKEYIEKYLLIRLRDFNFGPRAPKPYFEWKRLGKENLETTRAVITELIRQGRVKVDVEQLGEYLGMDVTEIEVIQDTSTNPEQDTRIGRDKPDREAGRGVDEPRATGREVAARIRKQVNKEFRSGTLQGAKIELGYQRRMTESFIAEGRSEDEAQAIVTSIYSRLERVMGDLTGIADEFTGAADFMSIVERHIDHAIEDAA